MKITRLFAIALIAAAGFTACSKDNVDGPGTDPETQSIHIQIAKPTEVRSIDDPENIATNPVVFSGGHLFLCDVSGKIDYMYTFSSTQPTNLATKIIAIGDATSATGVTITGIKGTVKNAYIVGNGSAIGVTYTNVAAEGNFISAVKAVALSPSMQYNSTNKDLSAATLYGEAALVNDPTVSGGTDDTKKYAEIEIRPHVARIEISDIKAVPTTDATPVNVLTYNVEGVYINNHIPTLTLDWTTPGAVVNPGQGGATVYGNGIAPYTTQGVLHDHSSTYFGNSDPTALIKYPNGTNNDKVWAYNLLAAPKFGTGSFANATTPAPHIIIAINSVTASNGQDYSGMRFLTVNKLFKSDGTTEIEQIEAGRIYTIEPGDFEFTVKHVHEEAETGEIDLRVKVTQIAWTTESMKPGLQ